MSTAPPPSSSAPANRITALQVVSRVGASLVGGYAFVWGFISAGTALGVAAGMSFADAHTLLQMLAFLVFLAAFCWAFAARSLWRVWLWLAAGGAAMTLGGWWLASKLV